MNKQLNQSVLVSKESIFFVVITLTSLCVLFKYVDLKPHVDNDFFFSNNDPNYQDDHKISKLFERKDSQLIISIKGNIYTKSYQDKIQNLTEILSTFQGVNSVKSITSDPKNVRDALKSPLWR